MLKELLALLREMFDADDREGCGFYNDPKWLAAYTELRQLLEEDV